MDQKYQSTIPQDKFLNLSTKYRGFVGGYGCLRESMKIITQKGAIPIADIDGSTPLLSWSEMNNRLELAPSTASFPKGKENLYRVITSQGEFVASGLHHVFCADYKYRPVQNLAAGEKLFASYESQLLTKPGDAPLLSFSNETYFSQIILNYLYRYANEARLYGQQLHSLLESVLTFSPLQACVQVSGHNFSPGLPLQAGDLLAQAQAHNRRDLLPGHSDMQDLQAHVAPPAVRGEDRISSLSAERILQNSQQLLQCLLSSVFHRKGFLSNLNHISNNRKLAYKTPYLEYCSRTESIYTIERLKSQEWFWDLSVFNNNNYLTEDGTIHHNSGKTWVGCQAQGEHYWQWPKVNQGYFGPTYSVIRDIYYPTVEEVAFSMGLNVDIKQGNHEVHVYSGRQYRGTTICRSMDSPGTIIGFKIGHALVDELDVLPIDKAQTAWRKIIARLRYNVPDMKNGIDVTTTPEGFRFCHKLFVQLVQENPELAQNYGMIQASTYANSANLPPDYIPSLKEIYPAELIEAYINGQFVNLTSGTVMRQYDRIRCGSTETIQEKEPLLIGQDFNTQRMASCVFVQRPSGWHAVAELKDLFDTPDVIRVINERWRDKGHRIIIYPDASGASHKSVDASKSDIGLLQQAGYVIRANPSNPAVKDRILATNKALETGKVKVNARECPTTARCLEQLAYDANGEVDKNSGFDHSVDAFSYPIAYEMPVIRPMSRLKIVGI